MKTRFVYWTMIFTSFGLISCGPSSNSTTTKEESQLNSLIDQSNIKYVDQLNSHLSRKKNWASKTNWQRTYTVDGNNVDKTDYLEKHKSQKIAHVYESFQSLESVKDTFSSDTKTPSLIFNYKSKLEKYSKNRRGYYPRLFQLCFNQCVNGDHSIVIMDNIFFPIRPIDFYPSCSFLNISRTLANVWPYICSLPPSAGKAME